MEKGWRFMKTAEERAQELLTALGVAWSSDTLKRVALSFKEYAHDCVRMRMEIDALDVQSFAPAPPTERRDYGGSTTPSACCDTGCTNPPC